jgi:membrane-bound metal-dependent hydrolase YbcI (DUF457 family)
MHGQEDAYRTFPLSVDTVTRSSCNTASPMVLNRGQCKGHCLSRGASTAVSSRQWTCYRLRCGCAHLRLKVDESMTQVGHILTGVACGVLSLPSSVSKTRCVLQLTVFIVLANVPDIPLPYWGHARYDISHSIFVNLLPCVLMLAVLFRGFRDRAADWRILSLGIAAWFSHLLLDAFYNHGSGVGIFWPFSTATVALPIPWFSVLVAPIWPLTAEGIRIGLIEFISYGPLVLMTLYVRNREAVWDSWKSRYLQGA